MAEAIFGIGRWRENAWQIEAWLKIVVVVISGAYIASRIMRLIRRRVSWWARGEKAA